MNIRKVTIHDLGSNEYMLMLMDENNKPQMSESMNEEVMLQKIVEYKNTYKLNESDISVSVGYHLVLLEQDEINSLKSKIDNIFSN
jgi:hypothetical protein